MATIWELDFYSRPLLDENKKKIWELAVCEAPLQVDSQLESLFRYAEFCPNSEVNSAWLKQAIAAAIAQSPKPPDKIRFFRQAMNNMIMKACTDLSIPAQLSRRTLALNQWLNQRLTEVYPTMAGFQAGSSPTVSFATIPPQPLPDALRGQKWAFVGLDAQVLKEMNQWEIGFGEAFPLALTRLAPETPVPGLIIFSSRALPLAAWMSGLELAFLKLDFGPPARLLLETGINDRWVLAALSTPDLRQEAENFEAAKQKAEGVHFLAVQPDPGSQAFAGFWLLQETVLA